MPNTIKYSTGSDTLSLKKGNFYIGVGDVSKYPTSTTGHWSAINPPSGGYTIYEYKTSDGPSIRVPVDNATLVDYANRLYSGSTSVINNYIDAISYLNQIPTILCVNREYEPIITDGLTLHVDAGYVPSAIFYFAGGYWKDMSYNSNNGNIINGGGWSSGGGFFIFNGTNSYVNAGTTSTLDITGNLTVSSWVVPTGFSTQGNIVAKNTNLGYRMRFQSDGTFWMYSNGNSLTSPSAYTINNWYYVTAVFSSTGLKMYVNGSLVNSNSTAFSPSYSTSSFYIGCFSSTQEFFQGYISIVSVYNRELSGTEILQNFNAQRSRYGI